METAIIIIIITPHYHTYSQLHNGLLICPLRLSLHLCSSFLLGRRRRRRRPGGRLRPASNLCLQKRHYQAAARPEETPALPSRSGHGRSSRDITISGKIPARIYLPRLESRSEKLPVLIWYHGGGFCMGSAFASGDHQFLNILASKSKILAVSVDYRIAPEHLLPAAYEDSWAAVQWVASHAVPGSTRPIKPDPALLQHGNFSRVFLGGDSSGANIVHNMIVRSAGEKLPGNLRVFGGILTHPFFWGSKDGDTQSFWYRDWSFVYPAAPGGIDNPMINPFSNPIAGLRTSRIFVSVAELDGLKGKGVEYVKALNGSGWRGEMELLEVAGVEHSFYLNHIHSSKAYYLITQIAKFISH